MSGTELSWIYNEPWWFGGLSNIYEQSMTASNLPQRDGYRPFPPCVDATHTNTHIVTIAIALADAENNNKSIMNDAGGKELLHCRNILTLAPI